MATTSKEPWSKKHKHVTRASHGGTTYSLSNSFAEPLTQHELTTLTRERGDVELLAEYQNHPLGYVPGTVTACVSGRTAGIHSCTRTLTKVVRTLKGQLTATCRLPPKHSSQCTQHTAPAC